MFVPEISPLTPHTSFRQMVAEKQKAEEKEREAQQALREETADGGPGQVAGQEQVPRQGPEPSEDREPSAVEPEVWPSDEPLAESSPPEEVPSLEKPPTPQKNPAESHEKVPSSREKRESRRQRGLEHVKLQNKHIQSCKEEIALREPSGRAILEQEESLPEDRKESREDETLSDLGTEAENAFKQQPEEPPRAVPAGQLPGETPKVPQGGDPTPGHVERPTSLALDNRVGEPTPSTTPETPKDKSKLGGDLRAQDRPESPGGSTQIQRYRDPDSERLASAVELWRGKKLMAASSSTMLSQSLDLSERYRAMEATLTPAE